VSVNGHGRASASVRLAGQSTVVEAAKPSPFIPGFVQGNGVGALLMALLVGAAVLIAAILALATPRSTRLRRRLEPHLATKVRTAERKTVRERFGAASGVFQATEQAFGRFKVWHRLHALLERADVPLRTVEFFYCMVLPGLGLGFLAAMAAAPTFAILIAMVIGGFAPLGVLMYKARRRMNAIDDQLPDLLITMAASLKAGHSFRQAMQAVVSEGQPPLSDEFKRVLTETQLGRPMDDALNEMGERLQSKNLAFVLTAVTIQRQIGGSLAGIFDMVADAVRQRQSFVRKIRSLTAMGRASAYTLVGLPFVLALLITVIRYEYVEPLYTTSAGHKMIAVGLVMMLLGSLCLRRIASFRG
jgi:tight adherence protein B